MPSKTRLAGKKLRQARGRRKVNGTAERPRFSVFISNKQVYSQIIDDLADHTLACASTLDEALKEAAKGKNQTDAAKLVGARIAVIAKEKGIEKVVFDKSGFRYRKHLKSLADAAREGGLVF